MNSPPVQARPLPLLPISLILPCLFLRLARIRLPCAAPHARTLLKRNLGSSETELGSSKSKRKQPIVARVNFTPPWPLVIPRRESTPVVSPPPFRTLQAWTLSKSLGTLVPTHAFARSAPSIALETPYALGTIQGASDERIHLAWRLQVISTVAVLSRRLCSKRVSHAMVLAATILARAFAWILLSATRC